MGQQSYKNMNMATIPDMVLVDEKLPLYKNLANCKHYIKIVAVAYRPEDVEFERDLFLFRRIHEKYLVSADFYELKQKKDLMCGEVHTISYFI